MKSAAPQEISPEQLRWYFAPAQDACWRWDDGGGAVVWNDGTTIALMPEIHAILRVLAPHGWPPFGAIVLLLAACRGNFSDIADHQLAHVKTLVQDAARREPIVLLWFSRCLSGLLAVAQLPPERRTSTEARIALCRSTFSATTPYLRPDHIPKRLTAITHGIPPAARTTSQTPWWPILRNELHTLSVGLATLSEERLALRQQTGVDELPQSAPEVLTTDAKTVRGLLDAETDDAEIGFVVRLARDLLGALPLHHRLGDPDGLPIGGVADLTNRGQLDRLTLSELANEDLVLAARVALGEALYLRRETPKRPPDGARVLLIDTGIRLWGTARLVATATALALAAAAPPGQRVEAWAAAGTDLLAIDLTRRDGVIALLRLLRPEPAPSAAIPRWLERCTTHDEAMIISTPRVLGDPAFRQALATTAFSGQIATVTTGGAFALHHLSRQGLRDLASANLDLTRCRVTPKRLPTTTGSTVAYAPINALDPFPLRVPHAIDVATSALVGDDGKDGVVSLSPMGHLTWWDRAHHGPRRIAADLPPGKPLALGRTDAGRCWALINQSGRHIGGHQLVCWSCVDGEEPETVTLNAERSAQTAWAVGDVLVVIYAQAVVAYSFNGNVLSRLNCDGDVEWRHGCFLRRGNNWSEIILDGNQLRERNIAEMRQINAHASKSGLLITRSGLIGPWFISGLTATSVTEPGRSITITPPEHIASLLKGHPHPTWHVRSVSRNGNRLVLDSQPPCGSFAVDLTNRKPFRPLLQWLEPEILAWCGKFHGMLAHVTALSVHGEGLRLHTRKDRRHLIAVTAHGLTLSHSTSPKHGQEVPFIRGGDRRQPWLRLDCNQVTVFIDGSGLLHLTDQSGKLPALAIVLADGRTACWCSAGWVHGPAQLLLNQQSAAKEQVATVLAAYAWRLS